MSVTIAGETFAPGTRRRILIPLAPLYNQMMLHLPVVVLNGRTPGPRLWILGTIHGDELVGIEVARRLLRLVAPERLAGTLLAVPMVNVPGMLYQSRYLPDRRDLNRSFPGSKRGSLAARIARLILDTIVDGSTHGIDLHTGAIHRSNLPQVRANLDDPATRACAEAFGAPVAIHATERDGSVRQAASARGVTTLLYEAGEALRHDEEALRVGVEGVMRVMKAIGMIRGPVPRGRKPLLVRKSHWVRAAKTGYFVVDAKLGDRVKKGQRLGTTHLRLHPDFVSEEERAAEVPVRAPFAGIVIGRVENPLVSLADGIVHVAAL